uniref:putative DNA-directed RNA polymerase subunit omega n=1 Tax=Symphyocladia marchantioides TaxID=88360 RepID=UPI0022FD5AFC|nr:putative DNA-directed RNA polymerase subunit omega [Symphyocladia marchantioides]WAX03825.1 putative DNA-directed RNA polymerase subunit omega [Symphyocladia marchantioides]
MNKCEEYNKIDLQYITYKTEELLELAQNRYKITRQVASRAKRRKYEDIDIIDDPVNKPIIKAIIEMVNEITEPKILED